MSQKAIQQVTLKEQNHAQNRANAQVQAKALVAQAQQQGQVLLQEVEARCAAQAKDQLTQVEAQSQAKGQDMTAAMNGQVQAMEVAAQGRMSQAVDFVVKKVVTP